VIWYSVKFKCACFFYWTVGLDYLSLDRTAMTLSGGEAQRIRLATQIGAGLTGVFYVLDEPSIGLHQRENDRLLATLTKLRDLGNTLNVVEHDEDTIRAAEHHLQGFPRAQDQGAAVVLGGHDQGVAAGHGFWSGWSGGGCAGRNHQQRRQEPRRSGPGTASKPRESGAGMNRKTPSVWSGGWDRPKLRIMLHVGHACSPRCVCSQPCGAAHRWSGPGNGLRETSERPPKQRRNQQRNSKPLITLLIFWCRLCSPNYRSCLIGGFFFVHSLKAI
jgi:hypothetical protein